MREDSESRQFAHGAILSEVAVETLDDLLSRIRSYQPHFDEAFIKKAFVFSEKAHSGQMRKSGEAYIFHPLAVAGILADLQLDLETIATGLLHDTVEDTGTTLEQISSEFGESVANLVDGVTKISQMSFQNTEEKQGENIRKMIVAMGRDIRVVLVKLADRLHNMRTLNHMPYKKQLRIAQETLEIYAPLASRLGMSGLKVELEDLSFRFALPDRYYELAQKVAKKKKERERYIDEVSRVLESEIKQRTQFQFEVSGRPKHLYSIYKKMEHSQIDYEQVFDVLAFRIFVENLSNCYEALGIVHALYKPIPGRFKDYIAMPKANNYQSLHTTVIGPEGERIEIQIRTFAMHEIAEKGIAAHWEYKERGAVAKDTVQKFAWLRELINWHKEVNNSTEFLETVKSDLFESEIYVFTPTGEVMELPEGATPLDFAYAIHTEVGSKCSAARVNGKIVPLKHKLKSGDKIEILTSKTQKPSKDWLKFCVTNRAKSKIRAYVRVEQRKRARELGEEILEKEFRKFGASLQKRLKGESLQDLLKDLGLGSVDDLFIRVGYGRLEPITVINRLAPDLKPKDASAVATPSDGLSAPSQAETETQSFLQKIVKSAKDKGKKSGSIVEVDGMSDILVHFAKCCHPIPGDSIVGFISRGRGITIHQADCARTFELDQLRKIDVAWTSKGELTGRMVRLRITSHDFSGLLKEITEVFSSNGVNILNAQVRTTRDQKAVCSFDIQVRDTEHLNQVSNQIQKLKGVLSVLRVTGAS